MSVWVIWLILALVLGTAEIFTFTAALGLLGGAALITSLAAVLGLPLALQLVVFTICSAVGVVLLRPIAQQHLLQPRLERFGVEALVGKTAQVVQDVSRVGGRVRIDGEEWTARAYDEAMVIPTGTTVDIMEIRGATALVYPRE